jgi:geranylgeranyl pyrophosphate synthase
VAEGSPIVMKILVNGEADALIGVACLNVLEKALEKILLTGVPCMAVPLLSGNCRNTSVDADWVEEMIHVQRSEPAPLTRTYLHLLRSAARLCSPKELQRLAPRSWDGPSLAETNGQGIESLDPITATEAIAYDFLARGGKHYRPFITLAVYDALTGGQATLRDGGRRADAFPDSVRRVALSIETFHKASLVHDDIEDNDAFRYGGETLHRAYGTPVAINVGDFLIGLGYRLVTRESASLGPAVVADILACLSDAHTKLAEGQGAELLWRDAKNKRIRPLDTLKIYSLKTAPAFEAALYCGVRLAGSADDCREPLREFARSLGVAYQILNDVQDWEIDGDNKLTRGGDILAGRPTVLWAMALESLSEAQQAELAWLIETDERPTAWRVEQVRRLYVQAGVFGKAHRLVDKYQQRARAVVDQIQPGELRRLLHYLIDAVLDGSAADIAAAAEPRLVMLGVPAVELREDPTTR